MSSLERINHLIDPGNLAGLPGDLAIVLVLTCSTEGHPICLHAQKKQAAHPRPHVGSLSWHLRLRFKLVDLAACLSLLEQSMQAPGGATLGSMPGL